MRHRFQARWADSFDVLLKETWHRTTVRTCWRGNVKYVATEATQFFIATDQDWEVVASDIENPATRLGA
jgi:hypothetical protein